MTTKKVAIRHILTDPQTIRDAISKNVIQAVGDKFPIVGKKYTASIDNLNIKHASLSQNQQKMLILGKGNASDGVFGDITVSDTTTNKVLKVLKGTRIMNVPYFTNRMTFLIDGNEYSIVNQLRTKSGVYTRKRGNEEIESSFNLKKGANFKLIMDPSSGKFKMDILHATVPLYGVLKILGTPSSAMLNVLGKDLFEVNMAVSQKQLDNTVNTLYDKLVKYKTLLGDTASTQEKITKIREYFSNTEISKETTKLTLGKSFSTVTGEVILSAAKRILSVYKDDGDVDERDNLEFQKVYSAEDIIKEVIDKASDVPMRIRSKLDAMNLTKDTNSSKDTKDTKDTEEVDRKLKSIFSPTLFSKPVKSFLVSSNISRLADNINPMRILESSATVTRLGEGAISSESAVPNETRAVNYSYLGTIDPVATPESSKIGIDNQFAMGALRGDDNELYKEVINTKTGKVETHRLIDLATKIVGFPDDARTSANGKKSTEVVSAVLRGKLIKVKRSELEYQIVSPHHILAASVSALPLVNSNQANRVVMGNKHLQQALPLKNRDVRLVDTANSTQDGKNIQDRINDFLKPVSPEDGVVTKVDEDFVYIKGASGVSKVEYQNNLPISSKTLLNNNITVKVGDKVKKGEILGDNNFSAGGHLALGRNLKVAYLPYQGLNHEDGIVISKAAAKKMTSVHADRISITLDKSKILDKSTYIAAYPDNFTSEQYTKLDDSGIIKKGEILHKDDPIILVLEDNSDSRANQILGNLHKSLMTAYRDVSEIYEHDYPGEVLEVHRAGKTVTVMLKLEKPLVLGDKLSGSYGNKGVATKLVDDDKMPTDENGDPIDVIFTPVGVPGRINPAQILESTLGKIATKTGKRYRLENFTHKDNVQFVKDEMKKHGVKDKETVTDPVTGKKIKNVFVGVQHIHKLFKTTESNYSARGVDGAHDQDDAPVGSGESGPKAIGIMEVNALVSHNARNIMKESSTLRSSKNDEFWRNFQYGGITHDPVEKKTFSKFVDMLKQAGIKVDKKDDGFVAGPLTDADVDSMSSGEIKNALQLDAKLHTEKGGLFDDTLTGGMKGEKWTHVTLEEPVINPVFEGPVQSLLHIGTSKSLQEEFINNGGKELKKRLNAIDLKKELALAEDEVRDPKLKGSNLDKVVKRIKYCKALIALGKKAGDAYIMTKVPIMPPTMRPITVGKSGDLMPSDSNMLYRDLILQNNSIKELKKLGMSKEDIRENRRTMSQRVKEVVGIVDPASSQMRNKGIKGAIRYIAGDNPKRGFFQRKVMYSKQNFTGRGTIAPDNTLAMDEIGLPEDMAWKMYSPFLVRSLVQMGYGALEAKDAIEERSDTARKILLEELAKRPVLVNRAPTLWKYSINAAKPVLRPGKTIFINTLWEKALGSDFDGDCLLNSVIVRVCKGSESDNRLNLGIDNTSIAEYTSDTSNDASTNLEDAMPFVDTNIRFNYGLINLKEFPRVEGSGVVKGNKEIFEVPEGIEVLTVLNGKKEWLAPESFHIHKDLKMVEAVTHTHRTIHCSLDHSLVANDENLDYVKAIPTVGITIPRLREVIREGGITHMEIPLNNVSTSNGEVSKSVPLDFDFGYLNGAYIGDGWINANARQFDLMLANVSKPLRDEFERIVRNLVGEHTRGTTVRGSQHEFEGHACYSEKMTINSRPMADYFRNNIGHGALNKCLPGFWMQTPETFRWGLLSGLMDTDGSICLVKSKAKKRPQTQASYTTSSNKLAYEIVALAHSLDMTANVTFSRVSTSGNSSWIVTFNLEAIGKMQKNLRLFTANRAEVLAKAIIPTTLDTKKYTPRISEDRIWELRRAIGYKALKTKGTNKPRFSEEEMPIVRSQNTLYTNLAQVAKVGLPLTRNLAKKVIELDLPLFTKPFWAKWKAIILDETIEWELVKELRPIPITEAYDLTIPPNYTMVTEAGFIVYDSITLHLPVTDKGIEDAQNMMPSKLMYSDKKKGDLLYAPAQEPILGLYKATKNLDKPRTGKTHKFAKVIDAWNAYNAGSLKMTDVVEIG